MCQLCDENHGELESCQDCGRLICFDAEPDDIDVVDVAYVSSGGDLFCARCGRKYDKAEEEELEDEYDGEYPFAGAEFGGDADL